MPGSGKAGFDTLVEIIHKPLGEKGEDALAYSFEKEDRHIQAVFDGCGGSGSWQYAEFRNATGAFISAQSMARACLSWFQGLFPETVRDTEGLKDSFRDMAQRTLGELKRRCAPMKVSGSLVKAFPCTASVALLCPEKDSLSLTVLNVGDSRVYFLTPQTGLVQLTKDDSVGNPDPMRSLLESAPLSDMLNADQPFEIQSRRLTLNYPCAVLCASDGVFGYFRSPMDFEFILLDTLMRSSGFAGFEDALKEEVLRVTGDDSTCLISFYGWGSFETVQRKLSGRYRAVSRMIRLLDEAADHHALDEALEKTWQSYRKQTLFDEMQG